MSYCIVKEVNLNDLITSLETGNPLHILVEGEAEVDVVLAGCVKDEKSQDWIVRGTIAYVFGYARWSPKGSWASGLAAGQTFHGHLPANSIGGYIMPHEWLIK